MQKDAKFDVQEIWFAAKRKLQTYSDKITPFVKERWIAFGLAVAFLGIRVYMRQGYAVITYLLGLFYLNSTMLYLAPVEDLENPNIPGDFTLPVRENDEYKGF